MGQEMQVGFRTISLLRLVLQTADIYVITHVIIYGIPVFGVAYVGSWMKIEAG